ncbi:heavy metal translocating P-type ATPase [Candidatus Entotheonella palauensis]|uniref:heavy metal translocating P-type ATPase n=1 Tax=Candidatus Entotheonella palauensis TaxID=93172 RepID=UPI000B7D8FB1|nr:heavy metal translocating P-type ATPase [Candidatus Entotheonella palauensis]
MLMSALLVTGGVAASATLFGSQMVDMLSGWRAKPNQKWLNPSRNSGRLLSLSLWLDKRYQHFQTLASEVNPYEISDEEKRINHYLPISFSSLGLAIAGNALYAPLSLFGLAGILYATIPIYQYAYRALVKERRVNIDVLYALTQTAVILNGQIVVPGLGAVYFYVSLKVLLRARERFKKNVIQVVTATPRVVLTDVDGVEVEKAFDTIDIGDIVIIAAGETIPIDGVITSGVALIDQHILTGEAQPVEKTVGDPVFMSTLVLSGRLSIAVDKTGEATTVAQIGAILNQAEHNKIAPPLWAEQITDKAVVPMLALGALSLPFLGPWRAAAVVDAHPQRRIIISGPLSTLNFLNVAAEHGILVKDGRALERLTQVDTVIFDKTGTLTLERPHVSGIHRCNGFTETQILTYAAAVEAKQSHPIAHAIRHACEARQLALPDVEALQLHMGYGLQARLENRDLHVGSPRFMAMEGIAIPSETASLLDEVQESGISLVLVSVDRELAGIIELRAALRPEAQSVIDDLQADGLSIHVLSGDHLKPTQDLAQTLGIKSYVAEALPEDKARLIAQLQQSGNTVCFVGDGINDAIAMQQADVSISLSHASVAAMDTAQILLLTADLRPLPPLFDLRRDFKINMQTTLGLSVAPALISLTGVVFFGFGLAQVEWTNLASFVLALGNAMLPAWKNTSPSPEAIRPSGHPY